MFLISTSKKRMSEMKKKLSVLVGVVMVLTLMSVMATNAYAPPAGNSWARADPEPYMIGSGPLDCVGLTDIPEVESIFCVLYDDTSCPKGPGIPCATGSDSTFTNPAVFSPVPGACGDSGICKEFRVPFIGNEASQTPGEEWHFTITFLNAAGEEIDVRGKSMRNHSFFVLPESAIGAIAMVGLSLATVGLFVGLKRNKTTY